MPVAALDPQAASSSGRVRRPRRSRHAHARAPPPAAPAPAHSLRGRRARASCPASSSFSGRYITPRADSRSDSRNFLAMNSVRKSTCSARATALKRPRSVRDSEAALREHVVDLGVVDPVVTPATARHPPRRRRRSSAGSRAPLVDHDPHTVELGSERGGGSMHERAESGHPSAVRSPCTTAPRCPAARCRRRSRGSSVSSWDNQRHHKRPPRRDLTIATARDVIRASPVVAAARTVKYVLLKHRRVQLARRS